MEGLTINEKVFTPKRLLTFGEVRKIRSTMGEFVAFSEKLKTKSHEELTTADFDKLEKIIARNAESDQYVVDALADCYGLKQKDIDKFDYQDAVALFTNLFNESTIVKKKQGQPYG